MDGEITGERVLGDQDDELLAVALARGRLLYRAGLFFEAHEAWEEAWLVIRGPERDLLQGLILVAAALHKARAHSNPRGAVKLLDNALERLADLPDELEGIPVGRVRAEAAEAREAARRWRDGDSPALEVVPPRI